TGRRRRVRRCASLRAILIVSRRISSSWSAPNVEKSWPTSASLSDAAGTLSGSPVSSTSCPSPHVSSARPSRFWPDDLRSASSSRASTGATWTSPGIPSVTGSARQKASKHRPKAGTSSGRPTKIALNARRSSPRSPISRWSSARTASVAWIRVTGSPCWRRSVANRATAVDSSRGGTLAPGGEEGAEPRLGHLRAEPLRVVVIFKQAAERLGEDGLVEAVGVERGECLGPVERLRDSRDFREAYLAERLHELRDLARQPGVDPGHLARDDARLFLERRVVDPEVEAPPPERVRQLTRPVRGEDHVRRVRRLDRADLGDRHLPVREDLEHEGFEFFVTTIAFVDQQHGRLR